MAKLHPSEHYPGAYLFICPGCGGSVHILYTHPRDDGDKHRRVRPVWKFNGDLDAPTFTPSLKVAWNVGKNGLYVCHSRITGGNIEFLDDCTHAFKGRTVPIPEWSPVE